MEEILKQIFSKLDNMDSDIKGIKSDVTDLKSDVNDLKTGQQEIKDALKHTATLLIVNFTEIRKDIRAKHEDIQADVNLLFKEVEGVKRQAHKIEKRLGN